MAKRRCEVYAESATVGKANVLSKGIIGDSYEKKGGQELAMNHLSYSTLLRLGDSPSDM